MEALIRPNDRRPRQFRRIDRQNEAENDMELRKRYRFGSDSLDRLEDLLGDRLKSQTKRNHALTVRIQILIALRFFASGCFLQLVGDTFGVDKGTVSRVISKVLDAIFELKDNYIKFPTTDIEKRRVAQGFFRMRGFPSIIGCIDGTHIRISSPAKEYEAAYVNRKHYHSVNVQATCDNKGMITSINAQWPGSAHDSHVFRMSQLCRYFEENHRSIGDGILLGDSGYPCRGFLLTPFNNPIGDAEERYNTAHAQTRNVIERVFGMMKRKFHVLHSEVRMKPGKVCKIVVACAVLYNLSILWDEPDVDVDMDVEDIQPDPVNYDGPQDGRGIRDYIKNTFFN